MEQNEFLAAAPPVVHLIRHGRIPDHRADHPLTGEGQQEAVAIGRRLAGLVRSGESIGFFASPTRRTRQTAEFLRRGLLEGLADRGVVVTIEPVQVADPLRNLQLFLNGLSYDPVRPLYAAARWFLQENPDSARYQASVAFQSEFWNTADPMGFWLTHPSEAIEAPEAVAERIWAFVGERLRGGNGRREICVSHSATLRAFSRLVFGTDPGEPHFCDGLTLSAGQVRYGQLVGSYPEE